VPNWLVMATVPDGTTVPLAQDIGRSLGRAPNGRVTFVDQSNKDSWNVATIAPGESTPKVLVPVPKGSADEKPGDRSQDFRWLPDGTLLMANGNRLLRWNGKPGSDWQTLATFTDLPGKIRRLAVSRDGKRVAFVVEMRAEPKTN